MSNPVATLTKRVREMLERRREAARRNRRRAGYSAGSRESEIANASPERAGELAGHAVERVET
jgi:ribosome assembly protein YihI (activator of Der GTPase)